jgi:hypothetical protein
MPRPSRRVAVFLAGAIVALMSASPVAAIQPERFFVEFDDQFTDTEACGFPIEVRLVGSFSGSLFFDKEGNLVRVQAHGEDVGTVTNPANGKTATGVDHWLERFDVESGEFAILGLFFHLNVPGHGIVLLDAGHIRFDANGEVLHLAGPHQAFVGDFSALCAALE